MRIELSRRNVHRLMRLALVGLFMAQGLLKAIIFMMPGTIAYFESLGAPGWMPAAIVAAELFLIMQIGLAMAGFYPEPVAEPADRSSRIGHSGRSSP